MSPASDGLNVKRQYRCGKEAPAMPESGLTVYEPGLYRITVQGELQEDWSDYVSGIRLRMQETRSGTVTELLCPVLDQASLTGILGRLYGLGLPLLGLEYLGKQDPSAAAALQKAVPAAPVVRRNET